jgi:hypothetical protein
MRVSGGSVATHVTSSDTQRYQAMWSWILGYDTRNDTGTFIAENHSLWERDLGKRLIS